MGMAANAHPRAVFHLQNQASFAVGLRVVDNHTTDGLQVATGDLLGHVLVQLQVRAEVISCLLRRKLLT